MIYIIYIYIYIYIYKFNGICINFMYSRCGVVGVYRLCMEIKYVAYICLGVCTSREYVYYIGPLKGSMLNAGSQKCCKISWKIRGWMEEMLQKACE